jgi:hypothetical protein
MAADQRLDIHAINTCQPTPGKPDDRYCALVTWWRRGARSDKHERPRGMPDLRTFKKSSAYYYDLHLQAIREDGNFEKRVMASWGLIARGRESIPYLQQMLTSPEADSREDAAGAFAWMASDVGGIAADLIAALDVETDQQSRDSIILALGSLKSRDAIPSLGAIVRDPQTDGDTLSLAIESLGKVVRRRFDRTADPLASAIEWLDAHPGQ